MLLTMAFAIGSLATQPPEPAMASPPSDREVARACARILGAARRSDINALLVLLDDPVDLDGRESLTKQDVATLVQTWPEDFGPGFWRDVRDVLLDGALELTDGFIWRRQGTVLQLRRTDSGVKISAIHRVSRPRTQIMPVDAAAFDSGLARVREQIRRAVVSRDVELLRPILGPNIGVDFDDNQKPRDEFISYLKTCHPDLCGTFWRDVHDAISFGMTIDTATGTATAPYVAHKLPGDGDLSVLAITARGVSLRSAPRATAPQIDQLSYDLVTMADDPDWQDDSSPLRIDGFDYGWRHVVTRAGKSGWVSQRFARSGFDTRLSFAKIDGVWKLVGVAAAD